MARWGRGLAPDAGQRDLGEIRRVRRARMEEKFQRLSEVCEGLLSQNGVASSRKAQRSIDSELEVRHFCFTPRPSNEAAGQ